MSVYRHTTIKAEPGFAVVHEIHDAMDNQLRLLHFQGRPYCILDTRLAGPDGLFLSASTARELAFTLDHFARTRRLPTRNLPDPEPLAFI